MKIPLSRIRFVHLELLESKILTTYQHSSHVMISEPVPFTIKDPVVCLWAQWSALWDYIVTHLKVKDEPECSIDFLFVCLFVSFVNQLLLVTSPGTKPTLVLKLGRRFGTNALRSLKPLALSQDANIHFHTQFSFKKKKQEKARLPRRISVWLKTNWREVSGELFEFHFMCCLSVLARRLNVRLYPWLWK